MSQIQSAPPLRADARRNRDALLHAARSVFAEQGLDAPLDAIARRAGVGRATLYRRFPTREALISAIFADNFAIIAEAVEDAADSDRAFFAFLEAALEMQRDNLGFIELFTRRNSEPGIVQDASERYWAMVAEPLARAQAAGLVREDLTPSDTGTILIMLGTATANLRDVTDGEVRLQRAIALVYDALDPASAPRDLPSVD